MGAPQSRKLLDLRFPKFRGKGEKKLKIRGGWGPVGAPQSGKLLDLCFFKFCRKGALGNVSHGASQPSGRGSVGGEL